MGLLTLVAALALVYMSFKLASFRSGFGPGVTYRTILNDAEGIFVKTPIKVAGINAGTIHQIELVNNQALITFSLKKKIKLTQGSYIRIKTVGILGDRFLDIYISPESDELVPPGSLLRTEEGGGLGELTSNAGDMIKDLKEIVASLKEALVPQGQESPVKGILEDVRFAAQHIREMSGNLNRIVRKNDENINAVLANLNRITTTLAQESDRENADSLANSLGDVKATLKDMRVIVSDLKAGKGTVGKLLRDEELIDKVTETVDNANSVLGRIRSMHTQIGIYSGYNTEREGLTEVRLDLHPAPERFYRFGVVASEYGPTKTTETVTTVNGASTTVVTEEREKGDFYFNAQIGRRLHSWVFRGGLIESSAGIGVDYWVPKWGTKFSLEGFNYDNDGPNLRLSSEVHIWNVFYARVAVEDMLGAHDGLSYSAMAGISFSDEDIKSLLSLLF